MGSQPIHPRAEFVTQMALSLFDRTQPLHELGVDSRETLARAAMVFNHRLPKGEKKPVKAIHKLIRAEFHEQVNAENEEVLAVLISLQRGVIKRKAVARMDLSPLQQREVLTLAAILFLAIGLDSSESQATEIQLVEASTEGMLVVVGGPHAVLDAAAAQNKARLWEKIGYPKLTVLETRQAEDLLPPPVLAEVDTTLLPDDLLSEAGRKVMRRQFKEMLAHEEGTISGADIEELHDMRVATRRMRASFEVFDAAFEPKALKPYLRGLRSTGRALGEVRDLDVFMEKAQHYLEKLPEGERDGLEPLFQEWMGQRENARAAMLVHLSSDEYKAFKRKYIRFLNTPGAGARPLPENLVVPTLVRELAPVLIAERLAVVRAYDPLVPYANLDQLHALRIDIKKLRYTVEYFRDVLGKDAEAVILELKGVQDHLGDLNDARVASQLLQDFLASHYANQAELPEEQRINVLAIERYLAERQAELARLQSSFAELWNNFNRPKLRQMLAKAASVL